MRLPPLLLRLPPGATREQRVHLLASVAFVAGALALVTCCTAPIAAATGAMVRGAARRGPVPAEIVATATRGLVLGCVAMALWVAVAAGLAVR